MQRCRLSTYYNALDGSCAQAHQLFLGPLIRRALIRAHEAGVKRLMKKDDSEEGVPVTLFAQSD